MIRMEKIYTSLFTLFSVLIVLGNLTYQKFVTLPILPFYTFELSVGAIIYPLTFLITDLIAEFYSKEKARFCVQFTILINVFVALMIAGMNMLKATQWSKVDDCTFHKVFGMYGVAFMGSTIACYLSQTVDIKLYLWIRKVTKGNWLWLRNTGSTGISLFIDTFFVITFMALFGIFPREQIFSLVINSYSFKLFFTICSVPLFYMCVILIRNQQRDKECNELSSAKF